MKITSNKLILLLCILVLFYWGYSEKLKEEKELDEFLLDTEIDEYRYKYQEVLNETPRDIYTLHKLILVELKLKNYSIADSLANKCLAIDEKDYNCWNIKGIISFNEGDHIDAEIYFNESVAVNQKDYLSYLYLGLISLKKDEYELSKQQINRAIELNPNLIYSLRKKSDEYNIENLEDFYPNIK